MAILKCKMCGGDLNITADEKIIECEFCGTTQTVPDGSDEKKTNLFNRANRLRMDNEFDKAAGVYESIVSEFPEEAEGYWGLVLCSYGIEYVDDAKTGKKIPTCHRTLTLSVMDDDNFTQACENADVVARGVYREEAKAIDRLQQKIIAVVENEEPYDVFICYKETDDITKQRTEDSLIAQDIYTELIKEGYKVFFSRVTLRDKAGTEYEPYIYAALKSAKIMLAIGTKFDYYDAVWVKNEWSRYISMMADDSSKHLIPCFKNLDAYDIPKEFKNLQALDMGEVTFFKNLTDNVSRIIPKQTTEQPKVVEIQSDSNSATIDSLLKRAFMFLEDGNWKSAEEYCEKVLDINPECAEAYLGKLMVELRVRKQEDLKNCEHPFDDRNNYQKAIRFGNDSLKNELLRCEACILINRGVKKDYEAAIKKLETIKDSGDSKELIEKCKFELKAISEREEKNKIQFKEIRNKLQSAEKLIAVGIRCTVVLKTNGTVVAIGYDDNYGRLNVSGWNNMAAISADDHTVGLKTDGTVVAVGYNEYGQCNVDDWTDIVAISAGGSYTVGLKTDGTVVAVGYNAFGQCNVQDWTDIVAVSAGKFHTAGLKADGTVVSVGYNTCGECDVSDWTDIVVISAGGKHTVGLKSDGTVVAVGDNRYGRCNVGYWTDIVAVSAGYGHIVGLKSDGTVIAVGSNSNGQCRVSDWKDIVAVFAGDEYTVGLKADGTVVATKYVGPHDFNLYDQAAKWKLFNDINKIEEERAKIEEQKKLAEEKRQKEAQERIELKRRQEAERARIAEEKRIEEEKRKQIEQQKTQYRNAGVCQHCGGSFKGFFSKVCTQCGKKKDY